MVLSGIAGPEAHAVGTRVGHYEIRGLIGQGGMGVVYRARDTKLNREVALKRPVWTHQQNEQAHRRFLIEARAASQLQHPNIVTIFEVFEEDGYDWLAMELVEGHNLGRFLADRGPLNPREVLDYGEGLADALKAAHKHKIVHRDVNPNNIFIDKNHLARLSDFGLARVLDPSELDDDSSTLSRPITDSGQVLGTAAYMSPEQALGMPVDPRSDIFSLGAVIYQMCTRKSPFARDSRGQILDAILHRDPPSLRELNFEVTPELNRIVSKCLAKRADERYQDAGDLVADMRIEKRKIESEEYGHQHPVTYAQPVGNRLVLWIPTALIAASILVAAGTWLFGRRDSAPPHGRPRQVTSGPGWEGEAAISPDGKLLAYASDQSGNMDIWVVDARGGAPLRLTQDPGSDRDPAWFADGSAIAFESSRGGQTSVWKVPRLGGPATMLIANAMQPAFSPDGKKIAFATTNPPDETRIGVASLDDPTRVEILTGPEDGIWGHRNPAWSPDGNTICYNDFDNLWLVKVDGGAPARLTSGPDQEKEPAWSPSGRFVYFSSRREGTLALWQVRISDGTTQRVTHGMGPERQPDVSSDGRLLAYNTDVNDHDLVLVDVATGEERRWPEVRTDYAATFTPGGDAIVFVSDRLGIYSLWRQTIDGIGPGPPALRLNEEQAESNTPDISPDGRWVVYNRREGAERNISILPATGGVPTALTTGPGVRIHPVWSPDGSEIAFLEDHEGLSRLLVAPVQGNRPSGPVRELVPDTRNLMWPDYSPDGRWIGYLGATDQGWEVWMTPADGSSPPRQLTVGADALHLRWNHAANKIVASGRWGTDSAALRQIDPTTGEASEFLPTVGFGPPAGYALFDVSPDGQLVVITRRELGGDLWVLEAQGDSY